MSGGVVCFDSKLFFISNSPIRKHGRESGITHIFNKQPFFTMTKTEREALQCFMINTLNAIFPNHNEYPFNELRNIEESEGDESDKFDQYG